MGESWLDEQADIWLCSASGGEAYLVEKILEQLNSSNKDLRIIVSTWTRQGYEILTKAAHKYPDMKIFVRFMPFDKPSLVNKIMQSVKPKIVVLLETEIWFGLMSACTNNNAKLIMLNARMSEKSFKSYKILKLLFHSIWKKISPAYICTISMQDALHYRKIFHTKIDVLPNIKFDRAVASFNIKDNIKESLHSCENIMLFASTRSEEEDAVCEIINELKGRQLQFIIVPRHLHRAKSLQKKLDTLNIKNILYQDLQKHNGSQVIIWDNFGDLQKLYHIAKICFVGGSLANRGGQNFLEALACGLVPIVGKHLKNFAWALSGLAEKKLISIVDNKEQLAQKIIDFHEDSPPKDEVKKEFNAWLCEHKGGTQAQVGKMLEYL